MRRNAETVTVKILDKEYQVSCSAEEKGDLLEAAHELDHRMREVRQSGSVIGTERISVMVALNLAHDLLKAKQNGPSEKDQNLIASMHKKLEQALG